MTDFLSPLDPELAAIAPLIPPADFTDIAASRDMESGVPKAIHHYSRAFHVARVTPGTAIGQRIPRDRVDAINRLP